MNPELNGLVWAVLTALAIAAAMWAARALIRWTKDVRKAFSALFEVHEQFGNNGGSTLRDAVDRIEKTAGETKQRLDSHIEWHITK